MIQHNSPCIGMLAAGLALWGASAALAEEHGNAPAANPTSAVEHPGSADALLLADAGDDPALSTQPAGDDDRPRDRGDRPRGWRGREGREGGPGMRPPRMQHEGGPLGRGDEGERFGDLLTPQEREELQTFVKENFPKLYEELQSRRGTDDRMAMRQFMRRAGWPMLRLMRLQKHDPELAGLLIEEHKIEIALMELRRDHRLLASESARASIEDKIRPLLEQRFDIRQKRLAREIAALEKRLQQAKDQLSRQETSKNELVDEQMERMLRSGGADGFDGPLEPRGLDLDPDDVLPGEPMPPPPPPPPPADEAPASK